MAKDSASGNRLIANNKKAYYDYFIEDKIEAGMELCGTEVKSIRQGKCSIKESYIQIINGEVFAINMNITPYEKGNIFNKDPLRPKKLLLHKSEINKLAGQLSTKGYTLVPLQVYLKYGKVKMQIGLAKGKKNYDKRESIAKKDQQREASISFILKYSFCICSLILSCCLSIFANISIRRISKSIIQSSGNTDLSIGL